MSEPDLAFISATRWQFATTMPDWPHEYAVKSWRPQHTGDFEWFCRLIEATGIAEPWPPPPATPTYHHPYLSIGLHKYWAMGPQGDQHPPEEMTVINRVLLAVAD